MGSQSGSKRKAYTPPRIKQITVDEARQLLAAHANQGDEEAAEMLEILDRKTQGMHELPRITLRFETE